MLLHTEQVPQPARPLHQPLGHPEMHQYQQLQQQQQPLQQSSPAMVVPSGHNFLSLTGSEPDATVSGMTTPGSSSNQGPEANNQFLGKRDSVFSFTEKTWNSTIPGFSSEDKKDHSEHIPSMMEASSPAETSTSSTAKETVSPGLGDHVGSSDITGEPSSEELASPSNGEI